MPPSSKSSLWATIDPASSWRPVATGGYTNTDTDPSAATKSPSAGNPLSPASPHFGFALLLLAVGAGAWWVYEGKGSGAKVSANLGPVGATVEGGLGKDE
jgi:hypothetical protein